ncbi:MAG: helix-turn-helix domain-containing protein [Bowdeniella nasicola]|nr:helix-turn-helix domain-containing protein [Bowdeniella nasicola]
MSDLHIAHATTLPDSVITELRRAADQLKLAAVARMESELPWWANLSSQDRSWLGLVAHEGINRFLNWIAGCDASASKPQEIFRVAPPELTRTISLQRVLQVLRLITTVVEDKGILHVADNYRRDLYELALIYSREVAFSAAAVYARAAETRGQWDARLEAAAIDAIIRGSSPSVTRSRVATLGWTGADPTFTLVGPAARDLHESATADLRASCLRATSDALVGLQGDRIIAVLGAARPAAEIAADVADHFGPGTIIIGPQVPDVIDAARSVRAAFAAHNVVRAATNAGRIVRADDLLPERALNGDELARQTLIEEIYIPLMQAGSVMVETLESYLAQGRYLEAAARELFVHPNTVRYRLRRIARLIGWDPTDPREGHILQIALTVGRLFSTETPHS